VTSIAIFVALLPRRFVREFSLSGDRDADASLRISIGRAVADSSAAASRKQDSARHKKMAEIGEQFEQIQHDFQEQAARLKQDANTLTTEVLDPLCANPAESEILQAMAVAKSCNSNPHDSGSKP